MNLIVVKSNEEFYADTKTFAYIGQEEVRKSIEELEICSMLTRDCGPFADDIAIALYFSDTIFVIPIFHKSYEMIYKILSKNFCLDYNEYIKAIASTENKEFLLWKPEYGKEVK